MEDGGWNGGARGQLTWPLVTAPGAIQRSRYDSRHDSDDSCPEIKMTREALHRFELTVICFGGRERERES